MQRTHSKLGQRLAMRAWLLLAIAALVLALPSCSVVSSPARVETLTIATPPLEQSALIYVAQDQKLFARNGLSVVIKDYDSGVTAIDGMLKGEAEIAEAAEFPFVGAVFRQEPVTIIASNDQFENDYLVGRRDRGINNMADLRDKRIGVALHTINEFYLGRFLALHGMGLRDVVPVDLKPDQFVSAITGGTVDAIIAWQPYIDQMLQKQAGEVVVWPAQSSQAVYGVLVCNREWLPQHAGTVERFLKSLAQAEDYVILHPDQAKAIIKKRLNYDDAYIASVWPKHQFSLSLEQPLIVAMKDEAMWMIDNKLSSEQRLPDFPLYFYLDGLQAIKPGSVSIVR